MENEIKIRMHNFKHGFDMRPRTFNKRSRLTVNRILKLYGQAPVQPKASAERTVHVIVIWMFPNSINYAIVKKNHIACDIPSEKAQGTMATATEPP